MLIVNADDVGASLTTTDAALTAFAGGAISSGSAMVWLRDSNRAAGLTRERGLPLGLHLNLTLPFDGPDVPRAVRERQLQLTDRFDSASWREDLSDAPPRQLLSDAVSDQLEQFRSSYGEPTHLDGHHHVHVHRAVLDVLPRGLAIRPIIREPSRADARPSRRERRLHKQFVTPDLTLAFEHLHPALGGVGLAVVERAITQDLEVMTHPQQASQLQALNSEPWRSVLARIPVGSFAALSGKR